MSDLAIRVESLSKRYRIGQRQPYGALRDVLTDTVYATFHRLSSLVQWPFTDGDHRRPPVDEWIWALKDVSFDIKRGEVVGIIGRNGAGKSTLLKILSRITKPTGGYAEIHGRVGSLLEVGTGFHPELTGRENIYLNGTILGMKKVEIDRKFDEIVDFAEIEKFLDTPVKHYSSGMYVRLAFAVAAHLEPEILIVDEVLAVGDVQFQKKCLGKMQDVSKSQGRTVLFVSHNMAAVQALCHRGILLSEGHMAVDSSASDAIRFYLTDFTNASVHTLVDRKDRNGDGQLQFTEFWLENGDGARITRASVGADIRFCFAYRSTKMLRNVHIAFNLQENIGDPIINCNTSDVGCDFEMVPEKGIFICEIKKFPLRASRYIGNLFSTVNGCVADWVQGAFHIDVEDGDFYGTGKLSSQGKVLVFQNWIVRQPTGNVLK